MRTATKRISPLRLTSSSTDLRPAFCAACTFSTSSAGLFTSSWLTSTTMSPGWIAFSAAGLSGFTSVTRTPLALSARPKRCFSSGVTVVRLSPSESTVRSTALESAGLVGSSRPACSASSSSPTLICTVTFLPSRHSSTGTSSLIRVAATMRGRRRMSGTSLPSNFSTISPALMPPLAAGPVSVTLAIRAPRALSRPRLSAISSVTIWMRTPSQPRRVRPCSFSCSITGLASADGTAKPMPMDPPEGE